MTTRHSLFTRGLSLLLALVMVLSNMSGLTLSAKAADAQLFDLITGSATGTNAQLTKVLAEADALPELAAMNVAVDYPADIPEDADYTMVNGLLELNAIGEWVPASYNADGLNEVPYTGAVQLDKDLEIVTVTYEKDLGVSDQVQAVYDYLFGVQLNALSQIVLLDDISNKTALIALSVMNKDFIQSMDEEIQALTLADVNDEDLTEEELAEVKAGYVSTLSKMLNRLVTSGDPYMAYVNKKGEPIYKDSLAVYGMLAEYDADGLPHYFANKSYIDSELKALSAVLYEILGEKEGGSYANEPIVDALLVKMGYANDVNASQLATMAQRMEKAAKDLPGYVANIDLADEAGVAALFADGGLLTSNTPVVKDLDNKLVVSETFLVFNEINDDPVVTEPPVTEPQPTEPQPTETEPVETEHKHTVVHVAAVEPGCHYTGNVEHWYCSECDMVCTDEAMTQVTNHKSVVVPAKGSSLLVAVDAVEPGCHYEGNVAYWICYECEQVWTDEALTQLSNIKNVVLPATGAEVTHVEAKEATETENGNVEYWTCAECEQVWTDEALTQLSNIKNVVVPSLGHEHTLVHVEAVAPACHYTGNVEHWYCSECDMVCTDEAMTQVTNHKNVVIPALGGEVVAHEAVAAGCHYEGNIAYWTCAECEQVWADEALTQLTNIKNVVVPELGGEVVHVEAVAPNCYENGNIEYWYCEECEQVWADEARTQLTNIKNVVVPSEGHALVHVEATEPSCYAEGNIEHWYCEKCETVWQDAELTQITNHKNVIVPAACKTVKHVRATKPSCFAEGNVKYWYCDECERVWTDEAQTQLTNRKNVIVPASCQNVVHVEAVAPTCESEGNIEYWYCEDCMQVWQDEARMQLTNMKNVVLPATHTNVVHMAAVAPACHYEGNVEHWVCYDCGGVWTDEALTQVSNHKNVIIPELGGDVTHVAAVRATCKADGNIEYWFCEECEQVWQDEARTQLTNIKNVVIPGTHTPNKKGIKIDIQPAKLKSADEMTATYELDCLDCGEHVKEEAVIEAVVIEEPTCTTDGLVKQVAAVELNGVTYTTEDTEIEIEVDGETVTVAVEGESVEEVVDALGHADKIHYPAVEAGCHYKGNVEYWYCPSCDIFATDEDMTLITNSKSVIIPELGGDVIHVEAKEATCYETGNIEHWYCEECEQFWADEARTQLTNSKNVILGINHDLIHMSAVEPGCHYTGNQEYWFCVECEHFWTDIQCTQLTNSKNVIVPAKGGEVVHVAAVPATCFENGNIEYWYCEECEQVWQNEALTQLTNFKNIIAPAAHELVHVEAVEPGCHYTGNVEHWYCTVCDTVWTDEALTEISNHKSVVIPAIGGEVKHVEAKAPNCYEPGNIEYWTCADCEQYWADEALTQITNSKRVILPAQCTNIIHMEAVAAGCHYTGNAEHWYCADCGTVWADEALLQITNHKNVIIPAKGGEVVAVEFKNATVTAPGNVAYWYCEECEQVWTDEALTQLSNIKNVILPSLGSIGNVDSGETIDVEFVFAEDYSSATASVTLGRGAWTMSAYGINGMELTANGEAVEVTPGMGFRAPSTFVLVNDTFEDVTFELVAAYPVGSQMNPETIWNFRYVPVHIEAGNDQGYYLVYNNMRAEGKLSFSVNCLTEGVEYDVVLTNMTTYQMAWLSDNANGDGTVAIEMNPGDQINIQVAVAPDMNWVYPEADIELYGQIIFPVGHMENPAALVMGDNTAAIKEGSQGYYYTWTAEKDGTLILTMKNDQWFYVVNNMTTWQYGDSQWSDSDPVVNPAYVFVKAGDELQISVNTYDAENPWTAPAGELVVNAQFMEPVKVVVTPGNIILTYNVGYAMTEADVADIAAKVEAKLAADNSKIFDAEAFAAEYTGWVVPAKKNNAMNLNKFVKAAALVNGEKVAITDGKITLADLGCEEKGYYVVKFNGEEYTSMTTKSTLEVVAGSENTFEIVGFTSALQFLADELNKEGNAGSFEVEVVDGQETLIANIAPSADMLKNFIAGLVLVEFDGEVYGDIVLNNAEVPFIQNASGKPIIYINAFLKALLEDDQFSSESLIAMGNNGKGEILHAVMTTDHFEAPFVLNLTSTPAQMKSATDLLAKAKNYFSFSAGEGYLDVDMKLPEEAHEAYIAYALLTGQMKKSEVSGMATEVGLKYIQSFLDMLKDPTITTETYTNTLKMLGVDKDLTVHAGKYEYLQNYINDGNQFACDLDASGSYIKVTATYKQIDSLLELLLGTTQGELGMGMIGDDVDIEVESIINVKNEMPAFEALVIDPARLNDEGKYAKAQAVTGTENLAAENIQGPAAVMLLADIAGDVTFNDVTLLDLNGYSISGNVKSNKGLIIVDSTLDTVSGATVGSVSGSNVVILSGTYGSDVSAYLPDGYFQSAGAVKNAMFEIKGGKLLVDPSIYAANVDGYLPAVEALAAQVAFDFVMNYYFTGALYAEGKSGEMGKLYDINLNDIVGMLHNGAGYVFDEVLDCIDLEALSDFTNKIIADLVNVDKIADALENGTTIATYSFSLHPWSGSFEHVTDGDYLTANLVPSADRARSLTLNLALAVPTDKGMQIPGTDRYVTIQEVLDELARIVVTVEDTSVDATGAEINLKQPVRDGKTLTVAGDANATVNLDFSHNSNYNRLLGAVMAYFDEDLTETLVKDGCIVELNEVLAEITVGQMFEAVNKAVQNKEIPFEKIAEKLNLVLTDAQLAELVELYDLFQSGVAKVMAKFDLEKIAATPLSDLVTNEGVLEFYADIQPHTADAYYKDYGVIANLNYTYAKLIVKFAPKCTEIIGDVNNDGVVNTFDAALLLRYCAEYEDAEIHECVSDVNDDGLINTFDAAMILRYCAELIDSFPAEHK